MFPFRLKFTDRPKEAHERPKDSKLRDKLEKEASGILAWLARGAIEWTKTGLNPPENITRATKGYQNEEDILGQFLDERCIKGKGENGNFYEVNAGHLFKEYQNWSENYGIRPVNQVRFGTDISKRPGITKEKKAGNVTFYIGIGLRASTDEAPPK
jgi:putative DNA primase/helicase